MNTTYNSYFYNEFYAKNGGGNYLDGSIWTPFFAQLAEKIVQQFNPQTVLDAGCACGYLVAELRKLGVEAYGVDISEYAIDNAVDGAKGYCFVHDITKTLPDNLPSKYDLVVTIEVLEHIYSEDSLIVIENLCKYSDMILFSSTPDDIDNLTHVNVRPVEYWCRLFAKNSYYHDLTQSVEWLTPWTLLFIKKNEVCDVIDGYERAIRIQQEQKSQDAKEALEAKDREIEYLKDRLNDYTRYGREQSIRQENAIIEIKEKMETEISDAANKAKYALKTADFYHEKYHKIYNSTIWKLTKPIRNTADILKHNQIQDKGEENFETYIGHTKPDTTPSEVDENNIVQKYHSKFDDIADHINELNVLYTESKKKRINLVTDTIMESSLLGGVATALIVASEFAIKYKYALRIITRTTTVNPTNYINIMKLNGLEVPDEVSYYSDCDNYDYKIDVGINDIFFATSWWSAQAILQTFPGKKFFYIIQEVETFFYPHGDTHYLCSRLMKNRQINFIVNSHYLWDYFKINEPTIVDNGCYFEPAFSKRMYSHDDFKQKTKYKMFFYARPNNPRNMYKYGLYLIDCALKKGIINPYEWDIYLVGQNTNDIFFETKANVYCIGQLKWNEYIDFIKDIDLAITLMYTPHPSYIPYDVACSGGVVVTNKCLNKVTMTECSNILMSDLEEEEFMTTLKNGIQLAKETERRKANFLHSEIHRDWKETLDNTLKFMGDKVSVND